MHLKKIGNNETLVYMPNGIECFYSYNTLVAGFKPILGWVYTDEKIQHNNH